MSKKDEIIRLWTECFGDSKEYAEMYFSRVYSDDDTLSIANNDGRIASSLQTRDFRMKFAGETVGLSYICGATTARRSRGRGYMSRLMLRALDRAVSKGNMMAALIPAHDWLYFFFERFGFSNVYLADRQCYTSFHPFATEKDYFELTDPYAPEVFDAFSSFEHRNPGGVLHSRRDFLNILDDLSFRKGGTFVVVGRDDAPIAAMAWAFDRGDFVQVNEILGIDSDARTGAMQALRRHYPDRQTTISAATSIREEWDASSAQKQPSPLSPKTTPDGNAQSGSTTPCSRTTTTHSASNADAPRSTTLTPADSTSMSTSPFSHASSSARPKSDQ